MAKYYTTTEELTGIADAIRAKGNTSAPLAFPDGFTSAINAISTSSSSGPIGENDVTFYDYEGTIVASYSTSEFASLSAMPDNPTHTGLIAKGWNWSLSDAKTYVAKYGKLNIGQMYITESGATEIDIELEEGCLEPILTICVNGTITIDWGDNTTPDTVTGASLSTKIQVPHTYSNKGKYTIDILGTENNQYQFYCSDKYSLLCKNTNATRQENYIYANTIKYVRIGNNALISYYSFDNCASLINITMPNNSIATYPSYAFRQCIKLSTVVIPSGTQNIYSYMFYECRSLSNVIIPRSVLKIDSRSFYNCYSLINITIPDTTNISSYAFNNCYLLNNIQIAESVTKIDSYTFNGCYSLLNINMPEDIKSIYSYAFYNCYSLLNIKIPNEVTSIESSAFGYCYSLLKITIPSKVTSIGNSVFYSDCNLKEIHLRPTTVPTCGTNVFYGISSDYIIYVPYSSDHSILEAYKTASNWSAYASHMQEEPAS